MADWGPVIIATVLFVLLSPGLLFQVPRKDNFVKFGTMETSGASILLHSLIFFALMVVFTIVVSVHINT